VPLNILINISQTIVKEAIINFQASKKCFYKDPNQTSQASVDSIERKLTHGKMGKQASADSFGLLREGMLN
jgi:hypothetical protein